MYLQIKVLLWKSLQLRKRLWLCTIIEIIVPCLLFYFIHYKKRILITDKTDQILPKQIPEKQLHKQFITYSSSGFFVYTPKTNETEQIMNIVARDLDINTTNIETVNNEDEMIQIFIKKFKNSGEHISNFKGFGIVFEEIKISQVFKYKIRNSNDRWLTNKLFPSNTSLSAGPMHYSELYFVQGFLSLQLTLDKAFINLSLPDNSTLNITDYKFGIQPYPFAKSVINLELWTADGDYFNLITVLSFLFLCSVTIKRIAEEKESGVKELMKMMGLKSWMIWLGWILHNVFLYVIIISIITYLSCFNLFDSNRTYLNHTNPFLLWIFLAMYMVAGIFFSFAISSLFNRSIIAVIVGIIVWSFCYVISVISIDTHVSFGFKTFSMILPNVAVAYGHRAIFVLEYQGQGLQMFTLFTTEDGNIIFSVAFVLFMFIIHCFFYGFIAWYFDSVKPGIYGVAKPLNFLCKWSNKNIGSNFTDSTDVKNSKFFEKSVNGNEIGISVKNVHKRFGNVYAVNGVNLDLYKGQITALLGQNGAGKTTTMSIITGTFSPSYGSVQFDGNDLFSNIDYFRNNLGICLQHNLLFYYLTSLDHLIFFGMLKGMSYKQAKSDGLHLLKLLNIINKKNVLTSKLSGGMKRKVSFAIALIGSPEVLILDEPTSGMDPESRREMWNILLSFRGTRTILITTQFMEEADVLGDRIAIMDHGKIKCYGTTLFLKKAFGAGYNLTVLKEDSCSEFKMIAAIKQIIPKHAVLSLLSGQVVINLPDEDIDKFPDLFEMLENNRQQFCIKGMSVSCTTMDEVFLRISTDHGYDVYAPKHQPPTSIQITKTKYSKGIDLLENQFKVLFGKKVLYTYRKWHVTVILGLIPIILGILTISNINQNITDASGVEGLKMSLSIYKDSSVYYRAGDKSPKNLEPRFVAISKAHNSIVNETSSENYIIDDLLNMCKKDVRKYKYDLMIAGDFNDTNANVIYNSIAIHTPAIAVNLYTNALLQILSGNNESYISTVNEPIKLKRVNVCSQNFVNKIIFIWMFFFVPDFLFLIGYFPTLPLDERMSGFKHLQMMTKLSPIMYWTTCFIWDYFCYTIVVILTLLMMCFFDRNHIYTDSSEFFILFTLLLIYGWSSIFQAYAFSYFSKTVHGFMLLFLSINFIIGTIIIFKIQISFSYIAVVSNTHSFWTIIRYITLLIPHYAYAWCIIGFLEITWENKRCELCTNTLDIEEACSGSIDYKQKSYFVFKTDENNLGILEETLFLLFSSLLYIILMLLFDYKIFARLYQFGFNIIVGTGINNGDDNEDPDISDERDKVNAFKKNLDNTLVPILIVDNLFKKINYKLTSVRGISFTVLPGECFGLLGINGAGKTTTFRMLTGEVYPSSGDALIYLDKLYKLRSNVNEYVSMIGYCPQYDALNGQLTCIEILKLMAILRGISPNYTEVHVNKWITLLGLEEYKNRLCGNYSGGNKRKLNTAIALIGDPPLVFLDEPTSGVDPIARRNLWEVMTSSQKDGQAVILTSHSMEECEVLCNRLTIMIDGVMKCIGKVQHLKNRFGQGFTIMLKLLNIENSSVNEIKADIESQFAPDIHLKYEHKGLLHYHIITQQTLLSVIFTKMNAIKNKYIEIEDYVVSETTLEEVFIGFAKKKKKF